MRDRSQQLERWAVSTVHAIGRLQQAAENTLHHSEPVPEPRKPSRRDRAATDRADGRYEPTPPSPGGTSTSSTVESTIIGWERDVQHATTRLASLVSATVHLAPHRHGQPVTPPSEPPTRITTTGRVVIDTDPSGCRRHHVDVICWLHECVQTLWTRLDAANRQDDPLGYAAVWETARKLRQDIDSTTRQLGGDAGRWCRAGCGRPAPPPGEGATCTACRTADSQQRRQQAS